MLKLVAVVIAAGALAASATAADRIHPIQVRGTTLGPSASRPGPRPSSFSPPT